MPPKAHELPSSWRMATSDGTAHGACGARGLAAGACSCDRGDIFCTPWNGCEPGRVVN